MASITPQTSPLSGPINDFSLTSFQQVCRLQPHGNVFLSPFGLMTALAMLMLGSRTSTERQLRHGLRFDRLPEQGRGPHDVHRLFQQMLHRRYNQDPSLSLSNYALVSKSRGKKNEEVLTHYRSHLHSYYGAEVEDVDFVKQDNHVVRRVNEWVNNRTHGLIQSVLQSPPDPTTSLMILNAIYFKGKWKSPFDPELTAKGEFHNANGAKSRPEFMCKSEERLAYHLKQVSGSNVHVVELPYNQNNISMIVFVPEEKNTLNKLMTSPSFAKDILTAMGVSPLQRRLRTKVNLYLPKFSFESDGVMDPVVQRMGMTEIFGPEADLSGINGRTDLFVSNIKHKAIVRVDEEGTEAAAVTSVMVRTLSYTPTVTVRADHAFVFAIVDRSAGHILFIGKVDSF